MIITDKENLESLENQVLRLIKNVPAKHISNIKLLPGRSAIHIYFTYKGKDYKISAGWFVEESIGGILRSGTEEQKFLQKLLQKPV